MCTIAAPALAASIAEAAICSGVTGTAGFLAGDSVADPVTAQEIMTLRCTASPPRNSLTAERLHRPAGGRILLPNSGCRTLPLIVRCAKPKPAPGTNPKRIREIQQGLGALYRRRDPSSGRSGSKGRR